MSWRDELCLAPSHNPELLATLIGRQIAALRHYCELAPAALLSSEAYTRRGITANQLFSLADGPLLIELDNGATICAYSSDPLMSVTIETIDEASLAEDWAAHVDASDPTYSEPRFARAVGRRIAAVRIDQSSTTNPSAQIRPREAVLALELDDKTELILAFDPYAPNNFAVRTEVGVLEVTTLLRR